jgi:hypothetical protein
LDVRLAGLAGAITDGLLIAIENRHMRARAAVMRGDQFFLLPGNGPQQPRIKPPDAGD